MNYFLVTSIFILYIELYLYGKKIEELEEDNETLHYTIYGINRSETEENPEGGLIDRIGKIEEKIK